MTILVTGSAGFIGFHLCKRLIKSKESLICIDNFNDYYDVNLKNSRISHLKKLSEDMEHIIGYRTYHSNLKSPQIKSKDKTCCVAVQIVA